LEFHEVSTALIEDWRCDTDTRVSSKAQDYKVQLEALKAAGCCERIIPELAAEYGVGVGTIRRTLQPDSREAA
jgi:hypothetical protein